MGERDLAPPVNTLPQRLFTTTGSSVSVLGFGTFKIGRNQGVKYPGGDGYSLPNDAEVSALIDACLESGINLLDTAPAYGTSEERLGKILGARRKDFFVVGKTGEEFDGISSKYIFTAEHTRMSVERSLKRLKTDYLDCVLVHSSRNDVEVIRDTEVLDALARLKSEGKIGSFGVSVHTQEGARMAMAHSDALMVEYNIENTSMAGVIAEAAALGKAVLIKKGLLSGHAADAAAEIRFILNTPGVTSLVIGTKTPRHILENAQIARGIEAPQSNIKKDIRP